MATYFDTSSIPFRPAVKIKPLQRFYCPEYREWFVVGRVTSRNDHCGRKPGDVVSVRFSGLYARQGVRRGQCGKLYWEGRMSDAEMMALPLAQGAQHG